ncbi:MAG: glycosyltransferase family 2 protein [Fibrobacteres bacterium]|nr:glycosyltransferase family 2 protein [Fibrobacterota bacterium]
MIAKNEEANLPDLLRSAAPLGAHLVVVDTGSTDRTRQIAVAAGAQLVEWAWRSDFAAARNVSLDHAKAPWVLWLDADDRLPASSIPEILRIAQGTPDRAVSFLVKNTTDQGATGTEFSQIRMFPNHPRIRFHGAIHEQVYPGLAALGLGIEYSSILVHHTGYTDPATIKAKQARNQKILQERLRQGDVGAIQWYQLATTRQDLGDIQGAEEGFRKALELLRMGDADQHLASVIPSHLASLRLAADDVQGAHQIYLETLDPDPATWHPNQTSLVAQVWERVEGMDAALEFWEKAFTPSVRQALIPVDPKLVSIRPLQTLAEHWRKQGKESLALELLMLLKDVLQDRRPPRSSLPDLYLRHGLPERAAELYAWCTEKDGETPETWASLVEALQQVGDQQRALSFLAAGRAKWPDLQWVDLPPLA